MAKDGCLSGFLVVAISFGLAFALCFLWAYIGMYLWNYVMPSVFGVPEITYWKMFALLLLARLLFPNYNINTKN